MKPILLDADGDPVCNNGFSLQAIIANLPAGLERAMLDVLQFHIGRENAISRDELVTNLEKTGFKVHEREARACINQMRKQGCEICSTGGGDGGYWLAADWEELNDYRERELRSRALDLLEQDKALEKAAEKRWGRYSPEKQMVMF